MSGRNILHAMTMLVPPAWRNDRWMSPELKAFFEYHRCFNEPWDGPAALVFTDGITVGGCLDRNGLVRRVTSSRATAFSASDPKSARSTSMTSASWRKAASLPGEMVAIDTAQGRLMRNDEIKTNSPRAALTASG
jgi:glutamate synthase (NADPH/NADH) large chain/glutamate synthase (ferredoxin)